MSRAYISGECKIDVGLAPTTYQAETTSSYFDLASYDKVIFIATGGTMGSTDISSLSIYQAKTSTGSGGVALGVYSTANSTATAAAGYVNLVSAINVAGSSEAIPGDNATLVINGNTYTLSSSSDGTTNTCSTATFDNTRTVFASTGNEKPWQTLNHLAAYINHASYGCPGIFAYVSASSQLIIENNHSHNAPAVGVTFRTTMGSSTIWITKWENSVEAHSSLLATSSNFNYVACSITNGPVAKSAVTVIRSGARYSPDTTSIMAYEYGTT